MPGLGYEQLQGDHVMPPPPPMNMNTRIGFSDQIQEWAKSVADQIRSEELSDLQKCRAKQGCGPAQVQVGSGASAWTHASHQCCVLQQFIVGPVAYSTSGKLTPFFNCRCACTLGKGGGENFLVVDNAQSRPPPLKLLFDANAHKLVSVRDSDFLQSPQTDQWLKVLSFNRQQVRG